MLIPPLTDSTKVCHVKRSFSSRFQPLPTYPERLNAEGLDRESRITFASRITCTAVRQRTRSALRAPRRHGRTSQPQRCASWLGGSTSILQAATCRHACRWCDGRTTRAKGRRQRSSRRGRMRCRLQFGCAPSCRLGPRSFRVLPAASPG
jgi:hypothetical protein